MPDIDLVNPKESNVPLPDFSQVPVHRKHVWAVSPQAAGRRRARREATREEAEAEKTTKLLRHNHARNVRLQASLNKQYGDKAPKLQCSPACRQCFPDQPEQEKAGLLTTTDLRDLRARKGKGLKGKRGICKVCGKKCSNPRWVYCSNECKAEARRQRKARVCECGCGQMLPEGSRADRRYYNQTCKLRAERARRRARKLATS